MYADDTHLTYADNDICSLEASLNQDLLNINNWLIANKLTLNMTKTEFMLTHLPLNRPCTTTPEFPEPPVKMAAGFSPFPSPPGCFFVFCFHRVIDG